LQTRNDWLDSCSHNLRALHSPSVLESLKRYLRDQLTDEQIRAIVEKVLDRDRVRHAIINLL
jgi:hypothetical protein